MLERLDLEFGGAWVPAIQPSAQWSGSVRTSGPFVALLVAKAGGRIFWAKTEVCESPTPISLVLHPLRDPSQCQLLFMVGSGTLQEVSVSVQPRAGAVDPLLPEEGRTGTLHDAFVVRSEPVASLGVFFLARNDVRGGRTGVWRPRKTKIDLLPRELRPLLQGGRKGVIDASADGAV